MNGIYEDAVTSSTRRAFLKACGVGTVAVAPAHRLMAQSVLPAQSADLHAPSVIFLLMTGGPSQLETFDPKPDAPSNVRGPFNSIETRIPGVRINEFLPKIAARMDRFALIRSLNHDASPIHETGLQLLQTGELYQKEDNTPNLSDLAAQEFVSTDGNRAWAILPGPLGPTGVDIPRGQTHAQTEIPNTGRIGSALGEKIGSSSTHDKSLFGENCRRATQLTAGGVRLVTVNMFQTVFHELSWDCHGRAPFSSLDDYRRTILPQFDAAFTGLFDELERSGRLASTLVVATGEFGRTPKLNREGGRDHWTSAWSAIVAGGGIKGGHVIGKTDRYAAEPIDRPVRPEELFATIKHHLQLTSQSDRTHAPMTELWS